MTDNRIYYYSSPIPSTPPARKSPGQPVVATGAEETKFAAVLSQKMQGLKFSQHAQTRLKARHIQLSPADVTKLGRAVDLAEQKGARDTLVMLEQGPGRRVAFIVSVPNRTVITALDNASMRENVFTNIDSAVIV